MKKTIKLGLISFSSLLILAACGTDSSSDKEKTESKEEVVQQDKTNVVTEPETEKETTTDELQNEELIESESTDETQVGDDLGAIGQIDYANDALANAVEDAYGKLDAAEAAKEGNFDEFFDNDMFNTNGDQYEDFTLEEIYGERAVKEARTVAENFLKAYFSYNGDNPMKSVERAEPYVTESLYDKIDESNFQSGSSDYYREFKKLKEVKSGKKPSPNDPIPLIYYVDGVKTSADKQNEKYTNDLFVLSVKKENGSYKVDSFKINLPKN